jgi:hypothetical protein
VDGSEKEMSQMPENEERTSEEKEVKKDDRKEDERAVEKRIEETLYHFCGRSSLNVVPFCAGDSYPMP